MLCDEERKKKKIVITVASRRIEIIALPQLASAKRRTTIING